MSTVKRALITGSTRGIGRAIALRLARAGHEIVLNYRRDTERATATLQQVRRDQPGSTAIRADVTDEADVRKLISEATADGPIDVLVNCVGDFLYRPFMETPLGAWEATLRSNLTSAFLCCREILPGMRSRGGGAIVNVASMNAEILRSKPNTLPYAIAKTGIVLLTKTLAATEGRHGIRVNAVAPGFVEGTEEAPADPAKVIPLERFARPDEVAAAVAFLLSDEAGYITGTILNVHGGAFL